MMPSDTFCVQNAALLIVKAGGTVTTRLERVNYLNTTWIMGPLSPYYDVPLGVEGSL
jgi:hypothetical protein